MPSAKLVHAIDQVEGEYYLSSATGRVWSFAKHVLQGMHLVDPCIISAGTQICNPVTGEILWQKVIPEKSLQEVLTIFREYPDYKLLHNDGTEDDYFNGGVNPIDFVAKEPVYFLEQVFVPDTTALEVYEKLRTVDGVTCVMVIAQKPGTRDLHIVNAAATKEHAVVELLRILGVKKADSIGIGDSHNDIHLFNAVGYKVAVSNAIQELKDSADQVIGSAANDGMADYLLSLKRP
ncbi:Cof-type HAD-IIB family hydrolase [Patescibacteria group bacterium]|nr:Cof-type HAD-IIB family hydrolase [Patescibacteria group bacterium]